MLAEGQSVTGRVRPNLAPAVPVLNDRLIRLLGIPALGLAIPFVARLYGTLGPRSPAFWAGQVYFVFTSWVIWHGNRAFLLWQRRHFDWFRHPIRKVVLLLACAIGFTAPMLVLLMLGWYRWAGIPADWVAIQTATLISIVCAIFITHVYETVHLIQQQRSDQVLLANLERARAQAELDSLQAQLDPHFMFNSLNTMAALIENSPREAAVFNQTLADVYRYILRHRSRELVPLAQEIEFTGNYLALLEPRFGSAIRVAWELAAETAANCLVPPISLQLLVENAVKHNDFTEQKPLEIRIQQIEDKLVVANIRRPKRRDPSSAQLGLRNLEERYRLLSGSGIEICDTSGTFSVSISLLPSVQSRSASSRTH